jgi:hypothetical protein
LPHLSTGQQQRQHSLQQLQLMLGTGEALHASIAAVLMLYQLLIQFHDRLLHFSEGRWNNLAAAATAAATGAAAATAAATGRVTAACWQSTACGDTVPYRGLEGLYCPSQYAAALLAELRKATIAARLPWPPHHQCPIRQDVGTQAGQDPTRRISPVQDSICELLLLMAAASCCCCCCCCCFQQLLQHDAVVA